jgi:hypothetical protein
MAVSVGMCFQCFIALLALIGHQASCIPLIMPVGFAAPGGVCVCSVARVPHAAGPLLIAVKRRRDEEGEDEYRGNRPNKVIFWSCLLQPSSAVNLFTAA